MLIDRAPAVQRSLTEQSDALLNLRISKTGNAMGDRSLDASIRAVLTDHLLQKSHDHYIFPAHAKLEPEGSD